ncbi:MAG: sulfoxide reductase heme-binding subunit YedZ [Magnetococcales bacterium]|nr:sulfoxide reductase heme-binding subunit YedZ [Magnetococcales bacterium]MBF0438552.1 sulfoxide reductase heme-binding subunit YedZ [Magnetococcales bacterium]
MYVVKSVWFLLGIAPLVGLLDGALSHSLGANPIERIVRYNGDWALRWLLLTLAITPMRHLPGCAWMIRLRRMTGLFAFFYATAHVASYVALDQYFAWPQILTDIVKRPYITVGLTAWLMLLPLVFTSTKGWIKRLGRNWQRLHWLIYPASLLGVFHFFMMIKADWRVPALHGVVLLLLLGWRLRTA